MDVPRATAASIPSIDRLLNSAAFSTLLSRYGHTRVVAELRKYLDSLRPAALSGTLDAAALTDAAISAQLQSTLDASATPTLRSVFNLTGTVLHTNLGRAVLPEEAIAAVAQAMRAPTNQIGRAHV